MRQSLIQDNSRLKNILKAISYWLNFEKICRKENLFNEKYLSYPIGQYLRSRFTKGLRTEHRHPFLTPKRVGSKPKIDFIIKEKKEGKDRIKIAIETKWISKSSTLLKDCLKDILRLALLANNDKDIKCYFIVSGRHSDWLNRIKKNKKFYYKKENGKRVNLLNLGVPGYNTLRPYAPSKKFSRVIESALSEINSNGHLPEAIKIYYSGIYPDKPQMNEYVAIGWRIKAYKKAF